MSHKAILRFFSIFGCSLPALLTSCATQADPATEILSPTSQPSESAEPDPQNSNPLTEQSQSEDNSKDNSIIEDNSDTTIIADENSCPRERMADEILPGVTSNDLNPSSWTKKSGKRPILDAQAIKLFNERFYDKWSDLNTPLTADEIQQNMRERLDSYWEKFNSGEITFEDGSLPEKSDFDKIYDEFLNDWPSGTTPSTKQYILPEDTTVLCGPHARPYIKSTDGDIRFSRNSCSLGRAQSRIEVIYTHKNGLRFVRTQDMWGWISPDSKLSPEIKYDSKNRVFPATQDSSGKFEDARYFTTQEIPLPSVILPKGSFLAGNDHQLFIGSESGFLILPKTDPQFPKGSVQDTHRPLSWNAWIETLFLFKDDPYGWGGFGGWRDCSRLLMDSAKSFGLHLARNSAHQARKTTYYLNVEGMAPDDKLNTIEKAAKTGIVLLHFKGHIMAYLGKNKQGNPMVFHALSEYLEKCPDSDHSTLVHTDRVVVSDLSLGENTSRDSLLNRITTVSVITNLNYDTTRDKKVSRNWTPEEETLYSAFIERLFDYEDIGKSWNNLGDVLRNKEHNILYNALGMHENDKLKAQPDCADLPYSLRAYFAWKRGLPMAVRKCGRGTNDAPPVCADPEFYRNRGDSLPIFNRYLNVLTGYKVHSGNARTAHDDDQTDFYPIPLTRQSLRPGTTYADPYGHLLMIAHYTPDTDGNPGALYAVDAQPDGTITRKRFWRGNFLFSPDIKNAGAGFKAFRPIICSNSSNIEDTQNCRQLSNQELTSSSGFTPYSSEQQTASTESFFDRMEAAIHPKPLSIDQSIQELTDALYESALKRLQSVQNGDDYIRQNGSSKMIMPNGYAIFETTGPWEDFATPSRDMRLLIAIDAVMDFPSSILRNAQRYNLSPQEAETASQNAKKSIDERLQSQVIYYQNSDNKPIALNMLELTKRADALEMAYHPADCNEIRWGAPDHSAEQATCSRHASDPEHQKMLNMRKWFHLRHRPPR